MADPIRDGLMKSKVSNAVRQVKAMLVPLENVCRYKESMSPDSAEFHVTPRNRNAMPFSCALAPAGINIDCSVLTIRELPVDNADTAISIVSALLAGRVRVVRQLDAKGGLKAQKCYVFDVDGMVIFKHRRMKGFSLLKRRTSSTERLRFAPYI